MKTTFSCHPFHPLILLLNPNNAQVEPILLALGNLFERNVKFAPCK